MGTLGTIELVHPIQNGDEVVSALTFREPTEADFEGLDMKRPTFATALDLAARLSGQSVKVIDELDGVDDVMRVFDIVFPIFERTAA